MSSYYVAVDGVQSGPFTLEQVRAQCLSGAIQADTLMWREGLADWQRADQVLQGTGVSFAAASASMPPPFPGGARVAGAVQQTPGPHFRVPAQSLSAGRGVEWIVRGWKLFTAAPGLWIVTLLLLLGIQIFLGFVPVIGSIAGVLLGPSFAVGVLAFAHRIAVDGNADLGELLAGFKNRLSALVLLGLLYFVMIFAVIVVGFILIFMFVGSTALAHMGNAEAMMSEMTAVGPLPILLSALVILLMVALVVSAYFYAPALVFFAGQSAGAAMKASFAACWRNWLPLLVFGLLGLLMVVIGALPFGLGLLAVLPVLFAANYASFSDMFGRTD